MSRPENQLEIDQAAIAEEISRIDIPPDATPALGGAAPGPVPATGSMDQAPPSESWSAVTPGLIVVLDLVVCPNWKLTDSEKAELAAALVPVLDQLFPGGLGNERHAPYFRLLAVTLAIAAPRFDRETFRFKPLREPKPKESGEEGAPAPGAAGSSSSAFVAAPAGAG